MQTDDVLAAKFQALFPHLDERQRRLALGAEARALGHGGIRAVARAAGVSVARVSRGIAELDAGAEPLGRARRPGGGRPRLAEAKEGLFSALLALVEPDERGDPMSPLRWTTKSLRHLADQLTAQGYRIGRDTVAALLHGAGFSLQGNSRTTEGVRHPDRDGQFCYINELVKAFQAAGEPVVSVDAKKKEQVGDFHQPGVEWRPKGEPRSVRSHSFPDEELGKVVPYGVYDLTRNTGWVSVGIDHDTAAFAVHTLRCWWREQGRHDYPRARRLLITADAGGSNGYRTRAWKLELAALARETCLDIVVCHFPPGTSKWNKIEHRLFAQITKNWSGRPLTSHEVVVQTIAATTTRTGLAVRAVLDTAAYPTGIATSKDEVAALALTPHHWHGEWNYTLRPRDPQPHADRQSTPAGRYVQAEHAPAWLLHPTLTGRNAHEWATLHAEFEQYLHDHPTQVLPGGHHRAADTGKRKLSTSDRLLATVINLRWSTHQSALAHILGVSVATIASALRETKQDLRQIGRTITPAPIKATTAQALMALIDGPETLKNKDQTN